jgi:hypothetical protein
MGLFKKKEPEKKPLKLPELPELPVFPDLPKFPEKLEMLQPTPAARFAPEMPKPWIPFSTPIIKDISEAERPVGEIGMQIKEPIFVKINKYKEVLSNFEAVKKKVQEASETIEKIRELRQKEEEQLEEWHKELAEIKEKINSIDNKLFLRIE